MSLPVTDCELLELAAKANGYLVKGWVNDYLVFFNPATCSAEETWNPLTNDGDALRLAIRLGMSLKLNQFEEWTQVFLGNTDSRGTSSFTEHVGKAAKPQTIEQATRRAIVRAAAEIGRAMP